MEKHVLESYFGDNVSWNNPADQENTTVELKVKTNSDNNYTLRIYLAKDYPNACPELKVSYPTNLKKKDGTDLTTTSVTDHTLSSSDKLVQLCHFRDNLWTSENTLYQIFMKGLLWLEAYEAHKRTGKSIGAYLREMPSSLD